MIVLESGANIIQLKSPDFHREVRDIKVRVKRTMANTFRTNINAPCVGIFEVPVLMFSVAKRVEFETFVETVAGQAVKYTDKNGNITICRITNQPSIVQETQARYATTLQLEEVF